MKTTIIARLSALTLSATFATVATLGVAVLMADSGERAQLAAVQSTVTASTLTHAATDQRML